VLEAGEIDDEGPEGMLTAELVALEPPPAQGAPQATFRVRQAIRNSRALGSAMRERIARAPPAPSPSHPFGMGPSLSRKAGEGLSAIGASANIREDL